jgi:V8-like Glu-specific endopeptidase
VCSGTSVRAPSKRLVITAGHCVFDAGATDRWATNWMFVPGKKDGNEPYGRWTAKRLATTSGWKGGGNLHFDVGAAVMKRKDGRKLQNVVGGRGIAFGRGRNQTFDAYGYPAKSPFTGGRLWHCKSGNVDNDDPPGRGPRTMGISCDMTGGSSGGGWVVGGKVESVVSYGYALSIDRLYGPYFGSAVRHLYRSAGG